MSEEEKTPDKSRLRTIRSFVRREGRMTPRQQGALDTLWERFGIEVPDSEIDFGRLFGRDAPVVLEIGFGMGQSLLALAQANPDINYLGIEVHRPGVGLLMAQLAEHNVENVRVMMADAKVVLAEAIPHSSLESVLLFFPDPWPKKRHHKRRLVQPEFVDLVVSKLIPGGYFHMATDWENYAEQMLAVASDCLALDNVAGEGKFTPRPASRPVTKFERRGQKLGHGVWDLVFVKKEVNDA